MQNLPPLKYAFRTDWEQEPSSESTLGGDESEPSTAGPAQEEHEPSTLGPAEDEFEFIEVDGQDKPERLEVT